MKDSSENKWRLLEQLAYEYVKSLYNADNIIEETLTNSSHDSGYDGIWIIITDDIKRIPERILMEAKLRNSQTSLTLNDCAKAIVIAFNLSAKKLYIVTNIRVSLQAKDNAYKFNMRTDLDIEYIEGTTLKDYIEKNREYLSTNCKINDDFLKSFMSLPEKNFPFQDYHKKTSIDDRYTLDKKRKVIIEELSNKVIYNKGIYSITGNAGVGKSSLIKLVQKKLYLNNIASSEINMELCTSTRVFYINILEAIWGVDIDGILNDDDLPKYVDRLLQISKGCINKDISNAVKHVLLESCVNYELHKDIYLHLLLRYIDIILNEKKKVNLLLVFANVNMVSEEVISFLIEVIKVLNRNKICIILEIRTPLILKNTTIKKSQSLYKHINNIIDTEYIVKMFERNTSISFIKKTFPNLCDNVCNALSYIMADNPLEIKCALKYLKKRNSFSPDLINNVPDNDVYMYWNELGIARNTIVVKLIRQMQNIMKYNNIFELVDIFQGYIPIPVLFSLFADETTDVINELLNSTIFDVNENMISCVHLRYLEAIKKQSRNYIKYQWAIRLQDCIASGLIDINKYFFLELEIMYIKQEYELVPVEILKIINILKETYQFRDILEMLLRGLDLYKKNPILKLKNKENYIILLLQLLDCLKELHEENSEKYSIYYDLLDIELLSLEDDILKFNFEINYKLLLWSKSFNKGQFAQALMISKSLYNNLKNVNNSYIDDDDIIGQIYNAYGLSLKMIKGGKYAMQIFEEGLQKVPDSYYIKAAWYSQQGNNLLKYVPYDAISMYNDLLKVVKGKKYPYQEILHTRIDLVMSYFLAGKYKKGLGMAQNSIDIAATIGIQMQQGRALNLKGCCEAALGMYPECIATFRNAVQYLEDSQSGIYLWRAKLNLATILLFREKNNSEAIQLLYSVLQELLDNYALKIREDNLSVPFYALLLLTKYLNDLGEIKKVNHILKEFQNSEFVVVYNKLLTSTEWKALFQSKVRLSGSVVLVVG